MGPHGAHRIRLVGLQEVRGSNPRGPTSLAESMAYRGRLKRRDVLGCLPTSREQANSASLLVVYTGRESSFRKAIRGVIEEVDTLVNRGTLDIYQVQNAGNGWLCGFEIEQ